MNDRVGLQFGDFTLDVSERLLLRDGRPVPLTPKAFDVLAASTARPGRLITKDDLLRKSGRTRSSRKATSPITCSLFVGRSATPPTARGTSKPFQKWLPVRCASQTCRRRQTATAVRWSARGHRPSPSPQAASTVAESRASSEHATVPRVEIRGTHGGGIWLAAGLVGAAVAGVLLRPRAASGRPRTESRSRSRRGSGSRSRLRSPSLPTVVISSSRVPAPTGSYVCGFAAWMRAKLGRFREPKSRWAAWCRPCSGRPTVGSSPSTPLGN